MGQNVVICDENTVHLSYLSQLIADYDSGNRFQVLPFTEGVALDRELERLRVDIAILDMSMSGVHTVQLVQRIREFCPEARILLMTEGTSFEVAAFELRAAHYLVKPVMAFKLQAILDELSGAAEPAREAVHSRWLSIETRKRIVRVAFEEIAYLEKDQRKVIVHTQSGDWDFYGTFKEVRGLLDMETTFVQCHQGYIVNIQRPVVLDAEGLKLGDGSWVPVSRRYRPQLEAALERGASALL